MREHTVNKVQKALNCGRKYSLEWADKQANNMLKIKHRHAVFTIPEFLIEEFRQDIIFGFEAVALLEDESMPELVCQNCGSKFKYKKTDNRYVSVKVTYL